MNGTITIEREIGTEVFGFHELATLSWRKLDSVQTRVSIYVEADTVIQPVEFTEELCSTPIVEAHVVDLDFDASSLVGKKYLVPTSFDDDLEDHVSVFYYCEHLELDKIEIDIIRQDGDHCEIRWTGVADDNCSETQARNRITVEGRFEIVQLTDD